MMGDSVHSMLQLWIRRMEHTRNWTSNDWSDRIKFVWLHPALRSCRQWHANTNACLFQAQRSVVDALEWSAPYALYSWRRGLVSRMLHSFATNVHIWGPPVIGEVACFEFCLKASCAQLLFRAEDLLVMIKPRLLWGTACIQR